ncbi:ABC transporter substrate-binding protein [Natrinema sp. LN54]|uniref:ABC transporter substrate-binding protein n=1 Tax=Natrinema sp. LN54 TaxID=3458705 RepID=UPI0040369A39
MENGITRRDLIAGTCASVSGAALAGCTGVLDDDSVAVSSKDFTEQFILSSITAILLEEDGRDVEDNTGLGGTTANFEALQNGEVDLYWEYTGTGWGSILGRDEQINDPDELYQSVSDAYQEEFDIEWLEPAPLNNTYVIVANQDWVDETGVEDLEDLASHVESGNTDFTIAMNPEIEDRDDGWGGLPETYDFDEYADDVDTTNMQLGLAVQAVARGDVELGFAFETDAEIEEYGLAVIDDTLNHFIIYNPAPNVRPEILDDDLRSRLNEPTPELDTETMRGLNHRVSIEEADPRTVAREWLETNGYI